MFYYIYSRLNVPVSLSDAQVLERLSEWADKALKGGRESLTNKVRAGVVLEHHDAQELYDFVMGGCR